MFTLCAHSRIARRAYPYYERVLQQRQRRERPVCPSSPEGAPFNGSLMDARAFVLRVLHKLRAILFYCSAFMRPKLSLPSPRFPYFFFLRCFFKESYLADYLPLRDLDLWGILMSSEDVITKLEKVSGVGVCSLCRYESVIRVYKEMHKIYNHATLWRLWTETGL